MDENELLAALPGLFGPGGDGVSVGSGPDDCAHVRLDGSRLAMSIDAFAENAHFLPDADPADVARKCLGASLSDLAASACRARWVLVSLCLRRGAGGDWAGRFAEGLAHAAREFGVTVVGGDTVSSPAATVVSVSVAGEPLPGGPLLRSGGKPGDVLVVTGELGGSLAGRHLRPTPRLREIRLLMDFCAGRDGEPLFPSAGMDISDGLALDLSRLCRESGVGAVVDGSAVPVSPDARRMAAESGLSPLDHALADGEDFELLLAMPERLWNEFSGFLAHAPRLPDGAAHAPFTRIGALAEEAGLRIRGLDGGVCPLAPGGYQHRW